jgi:hypothetical protein
VGIHKMRDSEQMCNFGTRIQCIQSASSIAVARPETRTSSTKKFIDFRESSIQWHSSVVVLVDKSRVVLESIGIGRY